MRNRGREKKALDRKEDRRVTEIWLRTGGAIDRIEFKYSDGNSWKYGGMGGRQETPFILDQDEYIVKVEHECMPQRMWAGAGVKFTTNKGRKLERMPGFATQHPSQIATFSAQPGYEIVSLRIIDGTLCGIKERQSTIDPTQLQYFRVYWMLKDKIDDEDIQTQGFHTLTEARKFFQQLQSPEKRSIGGIIVDIRNDKVSTYFGTAKAWRNCIIYARKIGILGWKNRRNLTAFQLFQEMLDAMEWKKEWFGMLLTLFCLAARSLADLAEPILCGAVFDIIGRAGQTDHPTLRRTDWWFELSCQHLWDCSSSRGIGKSMVFFLLAIALFRAVSEAINVYAHNMVRERAAMRLQYALTAHLLQQEQSYFDARSLGEVQADTYAGVICETIGWRIPYFLADIIKFSIFLIYLSTLSPKMTLASLIALPLILYVTKGFFEPVAEAARRLVLKYEVRASQNFNESVSHIRTVKSFSKEAEHLEDLKFSLDGIVSLAKERWSKHALNSFVWASLQKILYCVGLLYCFVWTSTGVLSAGDLTTYLLLFTQLQGLLTEMRNHYLELSRIAVSAERILDFRQKEPKIISGPSVLPNFPRKLHGKTPEMVEARMKNNKSPILELRDVSFYYETRPDKQVLRGFNMALYPGKVTALVGATGAGKTTIASLILRLYDPTEGSICFDGVDIRELNLGVYHQYLASVNQQPTLFHTTIRNNIAYGITGGKVGSDLVSDEEVIMAAKVANAHDFISSFPAGYDTFVGEQGANLSGGEKQRVAIARAVLTRPSILILDEATSALDAHTEALVQEALERLTQGCAVLIIAHRLSTIQKADEIICLDGGKVVERGRHDELLRQKGFYAALVNRQLGVLNSMESPTSNGEE